MYRSLNGLGVPDDAEEIHSTDMGTPGNGDKIMGLGNLGERLMQIDGLDGRTQYSPVHSKSRFSKPPTDWWAGAGDPRLTSDTIHYGMPGIPQRQIMGLGRNRGQIGTGLGLFGGLVLGALFGYVFARIQTAEVKPRPRPASRKSRSRKPKRTGESRGERPELHKAKRWADWERSGY